MNMHRKTLLATAGLAAAVSLVSAFSVPSQTAGFSLLGGSLSLDERAFRVWNNFSDLTANNNTVPQANFPGQTGAVLAIWKGHVEWSSGPYAGNGQGDGLTAVNPNLGDGGANFDNIFEGTATASGGFTHSELLGSGGSVLAFTTSGGGAWTIKYYSSWTWQDGPASVTSGIDLQGVACHEIGHSLGLGHTNIAGSTMTPAISGTGVVQRSIEADDKAGIQAIYGVKSASKPVITSLTGSKQIGQQLVINGSNFSAAGNEVWFTKMQPSDGIPVKVLNLPATSGNTVITVTLPFGIQDGEVVVKNSAGSSGSNLSNAFPIDIQSAGGNPPFITELQPAQGPTGGFNTITIVGSGFTGTTSVLFDANSAISFFVTNDTHISVVVPPGVFFTSVDVTVTDGEGSNTLPDSYFYFLDPPPDITAVTPNSGPQTGGTLVSVTGPSVVGVTDVQFDGVSGKNLEIVSANELLVTTPPGAAGFADVTATVPIAGSDTIVNGFNYLVAGGQFISIEPGLGGSLGPPILTGTGDLTPGSATGFTLTTSSCLANAPAAMFFSLAQASIPFKGGLLYSFPILITLNFTTDAAGQIFLPGLVFGPSTPSNFLVVTQTWVKDASGPAGFTGSNGLKMITP
jgi:hypothetical protein